MAFVPQSIVKLLRVPIDSTGQNQIRFSSTAAQYAYFNAKVTQSFDNFTYVRQDNIIKVGVHIDSLWDVNYVMYDNKNFTNKWFYAFIIKMEYIGDHCTALHIKTDVYQTWIFNCTLKESFIVRCMESGENVPGYMPGSNLTEEGLETGEYVFNSSHYKVTTELNDLDILILTSQPPGSADAYFYVLNGVPCGLIVMRMESMEKLAEWINAFTEEGQINAIVAIFLVPKCFVIADDDPNNYIEYLFNTTHKSFQKNFGIKPVYVDGYLPKNKKLLTYPYSFLYASNRQGGVATLRFEHFAYNDISFLLDGGPVPAVEIGLTPLNYKNTPINRDETLFLSGYPFVPFSCDVYKTWLAQNAYNIPISMATAGLSLAGGIATGNPIAIASGSIGVASQLASVLSHAIMPDQAKGTISGNSSIGNGTMNFLLAQKSITAEYAKKIDDYFTMYGYKQNKVMKPVFNRPYWDYIKTIDCNITGTVPGPDMDELKELFNKGITLWKNGNDIGNYELDNREGV